jgi:hypothetical protein
MEAIIDQLKNISQIEHSRHRSPINFVVHLVAGLIAYSHQDQKPGLHLDQLALLSVWLKQNWIPLANPPSSG